MNPPDAYIKEFKICSEITHQTKDRDILKCDDMALIIPDAHIKDFSFDLGEHKKPKKSKKNTITSILKCGDCIDLMRDIEYNSIDMVCADPPYGTTRCKWDTIIPLEEMWKQLKRITKPNGAIVLTSGQPFTSSLVTSNLKMFKQCLVWKKNVASNFLNANRMHLLRHEDVCIFYSKQPTYNKQYTQGIPYTKRERLIDDSGECYGSIKKRTRVECTDGKRNPISVLEFDRPPDRKRQHPTQKPVELMKYFISTFSNKGDTVLDFCMGS